MHSADHVQTAPDDSSATPQLTRRDLRAAEERARNRRREPSPAARVAQGPAASAPRPLRKRLAGGVAMGFTALFFVSASLPALAVESDMGFTAGTVPVASSTAHVTSASVNRDEAQSVTVSAAAATEIVRDGYTVTDVPEPEPEPVVSAASSGAFASVDAAGSWVLPAVGYISSPFGPRPNRPVAGVNAFHSGIDIAAGCGQGIYAAAAGTVIRSGYQGTYGNWVLIDHGNGIETGYAHNSSVDISRGQSVAAGERIGSIGTTGASTGCHLHFETRINGERVNPASFMGTRGISLG
ncbi:MAG: M23 family metallopeptidase [Cryobacterium sp.]